MNCNARQRIDKLDVVAYRIPKRVDDLDANDEKKRRRKEAGDELVLPLVVGLLRKEVTMGDVKEIRLWCSK